LRVLSKVLIAILTFILIVLSLGCVDSPAQDQLTETGHYCTYDPNHGYVYVDYVEDETGDRTVTEIHIDRNIYNQASRKYWADYESKHGIKVKPLTPEEMMECLN